MRKVRPSCPSFSATGFTHSPYQGICFAESAVVARCLVMKTGILFFFESRLKRPIAKACGFGAGGGLAPRGGFFNLTHLRAAFFARAPPFSTLGLFLALFCVPVAPLSAFGPSTTDRARATTGRDPLVSQSKPVGAAGARLSVSSFLSGLFLAAWPSPHWLDDGGRGLKRPVIPCLGPVHSWFSGCARGRSRPHLGSTADGIYGQEASGVAVDVHFFRKAVRTFWVISSPRLAAAIPPVRFCLSIPGARSRQPLRRANRQAAPPPFRAWGKVPMWPRRTSRQGSCASPLSLISPPWPSKNAGGLVYTWSRDCLDKSPSAEIRASLPVRRNTRKKRAP